MNQKEIKFCLAPIAAMAGSDTAFRDPVVVAEYSRQLRGYGLEIARKGVERACEGATWRPVPNEVGDAIREVLLEASKELIRNSMAMAAESYTPEQHQSHGALVAANRLSDAKELSQALYRAFWDMDEHQELTDPITVARLLPGWTELEAAPPTDGVKGLVAGLLERFMRIGRAK